MNVGILVEVPALRLKLCVSLIDVGSLSFINLNKIGNNKWIQTLYKSRNATMNEGQSKYRLKKKK